MHYAYIISCEGFGLVALEADFGEPRADLAAALIEAWGFKPLQVVLEVDDQNELKPQARTSIKIHGLLKP